MTVERNTPRIGVQFHLFESQTQPTAKKSGITNVSAAKNGLKIVQEQFVRKVLHVKLDIHRDSFFLH